MSTLSSFDLPTTTRASRHLSRTQHHWTSSAGLVFARDDILDNVHVEPLELPRDVATAARSSSESPHNDICPLSRTTIDVKLLLLGRDFRLEKLNRELIMERKRAQDAQKKAETFRHAVNFDWCRDKEEELAEIVYLREECEKLYFTLEDYRGDAGVEFRYRDSLALNEALEQENRLLRISRYELTKKCQELSSKLASKPAVEDTSHLPSSTDTDLWREALRVERAKNAKFRSDGSPDSQIDDRNTAMSYDLLYRCYTEAQAELTKSRAIISRAEDDKGALQPAVDAAKASPCETCSTKEKIIVARDTPASAHLIPGPTTARADERDQNRLGPSTRKYLGEDLSDEFTRLSLIDQPVELCFQQKLPNGQWMSVRSMRQLHYSQEPRRLFWTGNDGTSLDGRNNSISLEEARMSLCIESRGNPERHLHVYSSQHIAKLAKLL